MKDAFIFVVPGLPQGKGRARFGNGRAYTPAKTVAYEGLIAMAGQEAMKGRPLIEGPVYMLVNAFFPIPKSWSKAKREAALTGTAWHTGKPDGDNILKAVGDGLNQVVFKDDSQVAFAKITKRYAETARVEIMIEELTTNDKRI
jgi:Holliday junction resolvase RusA-like endonuclease